MKNGTEKVDNIKKRNKTNKQNKQTNRNIYTNSNSEGLCTLIITINDHQ